MRYVAGLIKVNIPCEPVFSIPFFWGSYSVNTNIYNAGPRLYPD
jgi:hypothetical protein